MVPPQPEACPAEQTGHALHTEAPVCDMYFAYSHAVQAVAPEAAYVPMGHLVQAPGLMPPQPDDCPAGHLMQATHAVAMADTEYVLEAHCVHV
jgi:hypothetical protein